MSPRGLVCLYVCNGLALSLSFHVHTTQVCWLVGVSGSFGAAAGASALKLKLAVADLGALAIRRCCVDMCCTEQ